MFMPQKVFKVKRLIRKNQRNQSWRKDIVNKVMKKLHKSGGSLRLYNIISRQFLNKSLKDRLCNIRFEKNFNLLNYYFFVNFIGNSEAIAIALLKITPLFKKIFRNVSKHVGCWPFSFFSTFFPYIRVQYSITLLQIRKVLKH